MITQPKVWTKLNLFLLILNLKIRGPIIKCFIIVKFIEFVYTINGKYLIISMAIKMFKMNRKSSLDCNDERKAANTVCDQNMWTPLKSIPACTSEYRQCAWLSCLGRRKNIGSFDLWTFWSLLKFPNFPLYHFIVLMNNKEWMNTEALLSALINTSPPSSSCCLLALI